MKVIYNKWVPFGSFVAMTVGPFIFTKRMVLSEESIRHEAIHWEQQKETLVVFFFLLYGAMFVYEFLRCLGDKFRGYNYYRDNSTFKRAYRNIAFEREAYRNEETQFYVEHRRHFAWMRRYSI